MKLKDLKQGIEITLFNYFRLSLGEIYGKSMERKCSGHRKFN